MGRQKINDEGRWRWFDTDEEYYAYLRVRSQFDSADEYESYMAVRAHFGSDEAFLEWLKRHRDEGYQKWLSVNGLTKYDSREYYQTYKERADDSLFIDWLCVVKYGTPQWFSGIEYFLESDYLKYIEDLSKYGGAEKLEAYIKQERERLENEIRKREERPKKIVDAIFGVLALLFLVLGLVHHWKIFVIILLLTIIYILDRIVRKFID